MSDEARNTGVTLEREDSGGAAPGKADLIREAKAAFARGQGEPYLGDLSRLADHPDGDWDSAAEAALLLGHYYRGAYGGSYANSPNLDRVRYCGERAKALCRQADGAGLIAVAEIEKLGEITVRRNYESLVWPMTGAEVFVDQGNLAAGWLLKAARGDCLFAMKFLYDNSDLADWMAGCNVEGHKDNYLYWGLYYLVYRRISQHPDADPLLRLEAADRATLLLRNVMSFCRKNYKRKPDSYSDANDYLLTLREHREHFGNQAAIAMEADPQGEDWNLLSRIADVLSMDMSDLKYLMKKNGYVPPQPKNADKQAVPIKAEDKKAAPAKKDVKNAAVSKDTGGPLKAVWKWYPFIAAALFVLILCVLPELPGDLYQLNYVVAAAVVLALGAAITCKCWDFFDPKVVRQRIGKFLVIYVIAWILFSLFVYERTVWRIDAALLSNWNVLTLLGKIGKYTLYRPGYGLSAAVLAGLCSCGVIKKNV